MFGCGIATPCCPFCACCVRTGDSVFSCEAVTDRVCRVEAFATEGCKRKHRR